MDIIPIVTMSELESVMFLSVSILYRICNRMFHSLLVSLPTDSFPQGENETSDEFIDNITISIQKSFQ